jgi:hypothetical protein
MMAGATFLGGQYYGGDADAAAAALRRALRAKGMSNRSIEGFMGTIARSPLTLWDSWLRLSSAIENANRRAVYDAAIKAGRTPTAAAYMARDLMDFSMQGDAAWVRFFADVLPFFNARLQGLYKLGRRAGTPEGKRAILLRGGVLVLASVGLMAWNMAMHAEGYDELEEWDKDAYWHIAPGTPYHVRIPKPFELGILFGTAPERMMRAITGQVDGGDAGDRPGQTFQSAWRAITGTLAINPIPQAGMPIAEQWANKRFFTGRPIEGMGDEKLMPELREEWYTSDTAKLLADIMGEIAPRPLQLSAKRIQHLWEGYTGGLGAYALEASDLAVRMLQDAPDRPAMALRDLPLLGRFARGGNPPTSTRYGTEFYELFRKAEEAEQSIKEYTVRGDGADRAADIEADNAWLLGPRVDSKRAKGGFMFENVRAMRKVRDQLSALRQDMDDVAMSESLSRQEKREKMDALTQQRNDLVRETVRNLRAKQAGGGSGGGGGGAVWQEAGNRSGAPAPAPIPVHDLAKPPKLVMVGDWSGLPKPVREALDNGADGVYHPEDKTVYVVMGLDPQRARHVALHELAGHHGLQGVLGNDYEAVMNRARQNPTVEALANAMRDNAYGRTGVTNRLALTEEALAELAAAAETGNYDEVERAWGVSIPASARPGLEGVVDRAMQGTRAKVTKLLGERAGSMPDGEVIDLLTRARAFTRGGRR